PQQDYAQEQQAYAPSTAAAFATGGSSPSSGEVEVQDGSRAMEIQTIYRDVVIGTRHLYNPTGKSTHGQGTMMLYAGLVLAAISVVTFVTTAMAVGKEKANYEAWQTAGEEARN